MRARTQVLVAFGMVTLLLAVYLPTPAVSGPDTSGTSDEGCHRTPVSWISPLPAYSPKDVWINFTVNRTDGEHGVRWTELWYQSPTSANWTLYAPPWNPSGHWQTSSSRDRDDEDEGGHQGPVNGTIIFDTTFTGGDGLYNFTTVAVGRGHRREPGPPDHAGVVKANTTVDSQAPVLFIVRPTPGSWTNSEWLQWIAYDAVSGVANVTVSTDSGPLEVSTFASGSLNMSLTAQGAHTIVVTASDRAGNRISIPISFYYDRTAPDLALTSPVPNTYLNTTSAEVRWTVSDPAGITTLRLAVDSNPAIVLANTTTSYDLTGLSESGHIVSLVAVDAAGNFASQAVSFGVDVTPPALQMVLPVDGTFSNAHQLQVVWMGWDSGSGIDHYEVSLDGGSEVSLSQTAGYVFEGVKEGLHTVAVTALDRAGNMATATSNVTVDYTPPTVVITSPMAGSTVYGTPSVNWTDADSGSGIARVAVVTDGVSQDVALSQTTLALPAPLSIGIHSVTVQVWDRAGNEKEATVAFAYAGATPPSQGGSSLPSLDFWFLMAILGVVAVGSAYFAVRRRRKPRT